MFHWNREASVEGSHIFLHANMNTHIPAGKNGSYLMFCFSPRVVTSLLEVTFCWLNMNNDNDNINTVNTFCKASTAQGRTKAKENTTKSRQELRVTWGEYSL